MALEACIAFLLADELDAEEYKRFKTKPPINTREIGADDDDDDDDDDEDGGEDKNYFSAAVPSLSVLDFQKCFQLTQPQVEELVNLLSPCHWATRTLEGWTVSHAVLASLWTLSTLEPHDRVASRFHTSAAIIRRQLNEFCALVTDSLVDQIRWPKWKEAESSAAGFSSDVGLPGVVCVLGSCLIPMEKPVDVADPLAFRDADEAYSVNLIALCNHRGCFTYVNAEHPGRWHNSRVLFDTEVGKALRDDPLNLLNGKHIVGDSTFPLSEHLLTPFPDYGTLGEKKLRYNLRVQAALRVVRDALRSVRRRFQRLTSLQFNSVAQTDMAVKTCCILCNMYLEADHDAAMESGIEERSRVQLPFHELPNGHSGSLGGISKRQDIAASLGRKPKKDKRFLQALV